MKNILEKPFGDYFKELTKESEITQTLTLNQNLLKKRLNKQERKYLLTLIDAKDLVTEEKSFDCFVQGFKLGLKIGYETNRD